MKMSADSTPEQPVEKVLEQIREARVELGNS